jgi:hypothetical protein
LPPKPLGARPPSAPSAASAAARAALLLRARREQRRARGVDRRQEQRDRERDDRAGEGHGADQALSLAEPGRDVDEADARRVVSSANATACAASIGFVESALSISCS